MCIWVMPMIRLPAGEYLTVQEYADMTGRTKQAIYAAIRQKRLKFYRLDKTYIIPATALITDNRITTGRYIGISRFRKDLDVEELAKKRGLLT